MNPWRGDMRHPLKELRYDLSHPWEFFESARLRIEAREPEALIGVGIMIVGLANFALGAFVLLR